MNQKVHLTIKFNILLEDLQIKIFSKNFKFLIFLFRDDIDRSSTTLPIITLYTHDQCSLCDDLVDELEMNFSGRYQLERVDITKKENLGFLRLYRLDIPVCFFNGQFLCKHQLNNDLLSKRLKDFECS